VDHGVTAVLTLSTEFLPAQAAVMLDGEFTVLGKVTSVLVTPAERIDLLRRSILGYFPTDQVENALRKLDNALRLSLPDVVFGPWDPSASPGDLRLDQTTPSKGGTSQYILGRRATYPRPMNDVSR